MYRTPKCSCLHLFFSALHTKRQQHAEPIFKQDLINTNPKHTGEEINKVLRNQEVKWCQSRRVHSKCSSKFVNNNFYLKRSIYAKKKYIWVWWSPRHQSITCSLTVTGCLKALILCLPSTTDFLRTKWSDPKFCPKVHSASSAVQARPSDSYHIPARCKTASLTPQVDILCSPLFRVYDPKRQEQAHTNTKCNACSDSESTGVWHEHLLKQVPAKSSLCCCRDCTRWKWTCPKTRAFCSVQRGLLTSHCQHSAAHSSAPTGSCWNAWSWRWIVNPRTPTAVTSGLETETE